MSQIHIGIGEFAVSSNPEDELKTFALGSCVAVIVFDKNLHVAGLMHIALPESEVNLKKAEERPGYFADTGIPLLLKEMRKHDSTRRTAWIKIVGGSNIMDAKRRFDIGKRNVLAIKKILWRNQLGIIAEDVGGDASRTVAINVGTGDIVISNSKSIWSI